MGNGLNGKLLVLLTLVLSFPVSSAFAGVGVSSGPASDGAVVDLGNFDINPDNEVLIGPILVEYVEKGGPLKKSINNFPDLSSPEEDRQVTIIETIINTGPSTITDWHEEVFDPARGSVLSWISGSVMLQDGEVVQGTLMSTGVGNNNVIWFDFTTNPQLTGDTFTITKVLQYFDAMHYKVF